MKLKSDELPMKGSKVGLLRSYSSELLLPVLLGLRGGGNVWVCWRISVLFQIVCCFCNSKKNLKFD